MNLKINTTLFALIAVLLSFGIWKSVELIKLQKRILALETELTMSCNYWIENLDLHSTIYNDYYSKKSSICDATNNKTSVLIYRYSKNTCGSCIQEDLLEIEHFQKEIGKEKVLLLPDYPDNREGRIELSNVLDKFNYVNIPVDSFFIPSIEGNFPQRYFAVIDNSGELTMLFFPRSGETKLTRLFFSMVKKKIMTE